MYGLQQEARWSTEKTLHIETAPVTQHTVGDKTIPSRFFGQPDTEHVSAIIFSNSGTNAKFMRMGYQTGYGCERVDIRRMGMCFNPDPDAMDASFFSYNLDAPPLVETWGQGLVVLHNPTCLHPLPKDFFVDAAHSYVKEGVYQSDHLGWHPYSSKTMIAYLGDLKKKLPEVLLQKGRFLIGAITREEFNDARGCELVSSNPVADEQGWFSDETHSFLGVVIRDKIDNDWAYVILARDPTFHFRPIQIESSLPSRDDARTKMQIKMAELLSKPQRLFTS